MSYRCLILGFLFPVLSQAYPEFIGYKYSSCLTCHYNSHGNGPINDYGRALWSAEIAGRAFAGKKTDEQLGETSGFLGGVTLPSWLRPGIKARQLWYETSPGTENSTSQDILMQADVNAAFILDPEYRYIVVASVGYLPEPAAAPPGEDHEYWITRDHYLRIQATDELWIFAGLMDKAYGIRIPDHTAFSRSQVGVAQNDQSHGVMIHWIRPKYELTLHGFIGNQLEEEQELEQKGLSAVFEYEPKQAWRIGASILNSSNEQVTNRRLGLHTRYGFGYGSSLLFEFGLIENTPKNVDAQLGHYLFSQMMTRAARGYHFFITGEAFRSDMVAEQPTVIRTGLGLLAFPLARFEFRIEGKHTHQVWARKNATEDLWVVMTQVHISL